MPRHFDIISEINDIEVIARGRGVDARHRLNRAYGRGNWRKLKGKAWGWSTEKAVWPMPKSTGLKRTASAKSKKRS